MINNKSLEYLRGKANALPRSPGVYLMKNESGEIIYVGKSKTLKDRVSSYFVDTYHGIKTARMVSLVCDFDTILCETEIEALTLENILIKKHTPKYNINLKDAKSYPYIKITNEPYPRIVMTRERRDDGAIYLGPYSGTSIVHSAIDTVQRAFSLPTCKRVFPRDIGKGRPCLYKQMGRCISPCTGEITRSEYSARIAEARRVLEGSIRESVDNLTREMQKMAEEERFEEAARLRDTIAQLKYLKEKQKIIIDTDSDKDVWALYECEMCSVITVLRVREGAVNAKNDFVFPRSALIDGEALISFIFNYYDSNTMPKEILLHSTESDESLSMLDELARKRRSSVRVPQRGDMKRLCEMAYKNANEAADKYIRENEKSDGALISLSRILSLEALPERIEAYDISNLAAEHITAGMIVYENGGFKKSDFRLFKIKSTDTPDDYLSMREALSRRLLHIGDGSPSLGIAPDLILLDGGKGHVGAVKELMRDMGIDIPVFGMVKDDFHKTRAMTDGERELGIAHEGLVYSLIYRIQEEVHRYTVSKMMGAKRKTLKHSRLEEIPGIGASKARELLLRFGSIKKISELSAEELAVGRISTADAKSIVAFFEEERARKASKETRK